MFAPFVIPQISTVTGPWQLAAFVILLAFWAIWVKYLR